MRATHIPTGVMAQSQNQRDQHQNKAKALEVLHQRLYAIFEEQEASKDK